MTGRPNPSRRQAADAALARPLRVTAGRFASLLCAVCVGACNLLPPSRAPSRAPAPHPDGGGIGIVLELHVPVGFAWRPEVVHFVRLDERADPLPGPTWVSNYAHDGRVYLLNMPPGRYAAAAAEASFGLAAKGTCIWYFPAELIKRSVALLEPGFLAYAGSHVVGASVGVCREQADALQWQLAEMVRPGEEKCRPKALQIEAQLFEGVVQGVITSGLAGLVGLSPPRPGPPALGRLTPPPCHYAGALLRSLRSSADAAEFMQRATEDLAPFGWSIGPAARVPAPAALASAPRAGDRPPAAGDRP